jgi:hypothetical protein
MLGGATLAYNGASTVLDALVAAGLACHQTLTDLLGKRLGFPALSSRSRDSYMGKETESKQLLHLVLGGELARLEDVEFKDLGNVDIVGVYPNYAEAYKAWRSKAQQTVDNAQMRYFIVHLHRLLDPETERAPENTHH